MEEMPSGFRVFEVHKFWLPDKTSKPVLVGARGSIWHNSKMRAACSRDISSLRWANNKAVSRTRSVHFKTAQRHLEQGRCMCGIYLSKTLESTDFPQYIRGFASLRPAVLALCLPYGIVYEAEFGYRAERVIIDQMWLYGKRQFEAGLARRLEEIYQCVVKEVPRNEDVMTDLKLAINHS